MAFTDDQGRAYNVHLSRETAAYALTYDARGLVADSGQSGRDALPGLSRESLDELRGDIKEIKHDLKDLRHDLKKLGKGLEGEAAAVVSDLRDALKDVQKAVDGFKKILQQFLGHGNDRSKRIGRAPEYVEAQAAYLSVSRTVTVEIEVVGPAIEDPWSVENTASRLLDFALGLFQGGERDDHSDKMAEAMEQGYREAETEFGAMLPTLARDTVNLAKELLESWAEATESDDQNDGQLELVA